MEEEGKAVAEVVQSVGEAASETVHAVTEVAADTIGTVTKGVSSETALLLRLDKIKGYFTFENVIHIVISIITILIFYVVYRIIRKVLNRYAMKNAKPHTVLLINKTLGYTFKALMVMYVLNLFGVNLSAIWGAAGVAGLAIGFAAQTSVSNIISGVFVVSEKAMKIGDYIAVDGTSGIVDSIDLLSVKVHTFDNQMIRIPNSSIINGSLTNYNHFDVRRVVTDVGVSYDSDLDAVLEALNRVPSMCPSVLAEPAPLIYYDSFGASSINLKVCLWCKNADFIATKNEAFKAIVKVSRETPFEIPYTIVRVQLQGDAPAAARTALTATAEQAVVTQVVAGGLAAGAASEA